MKLKLGTKAWCAAVLASTAFLITHDVQADPGDGAAIDSVVLHAKVIGTQAEAKLDVELSAADPLTIESGGTLTIRSGGEVTSDFDHMIAARPMGSLPERMSHAMTVFVGHGYSTVQAAGIVGNLVQESAIDHMTRSGDKGTAHGIAQWRGERFARLLVFADKTGSSWRNFDTQLAFVHYELKYHETLAYRRLMAARNVDEATAAMMAFERPRGWTPRDPRRGHGWHNRRAYAQDALKLLSSL